MLIKKAVAVRKHLQTNRKDKDSKFRLILIESRSMFPLGCTTMVRSCFAGPNAWRRSSTPVHVNFADLVRSPPPLPLLQDCRCPSPDLEVRERHCLYPRRIKVEMSVGNISRWLQGKYSTGVMDYGCFTGYIASLWVGMIWIE